MRTVMGVEELAGFLVREFPQVTEDFRVERLTPEGIEVRLRVAERHLRPGGTVSGPTIFALADVAVYLAILARIGPVALAVTTGASIDFLRKPEAGRDLIGTAGLLKLGRVLVVADVLIRSEGRDEPVARASMTYSIPPKR
ncbi:PaaI family thioesterase [Albidovulum sp.]|uniref:PaaI family thioesterase n=1 Tax=Albidovulum sp. TaxID=1872424 RepID=UPI0039B83CFD